MSPDLSRPSLFSQLVSLVAACLLTGRVKDLPPYTSASWFATFSEFVTMISGMAGRWVAMWMAVAPLLVSATIAVARFWWASVTMVEEMASRFDEASGRNKSGSGNTSDWVCLMIRFIILTASIG